MNYPVCCRIFGHHFEARESVTKYETKRGGSSVTLDVRTYEGEVCTRCGKRTRRLEDDAPALFVGSADAPRKAE